MKILYLPILESGTFHENAVRYKRGLYTALAKAGHQVTEFDYLAHVGSGLAQDIAALISLQMPDLMLTQFHGPDPVTPKMLAWLRALKPDMKVVNWSGDSWLHSLTGEPMLELLRQVDVQLVAAPDVLPEYEPHGIHAGYWNIAYEPPVRPLPEMPEYDVVFLGNVINEKRRAMLEMLRALPYRVGIYGDWEHADGHNTYDFAAGEALYRNARIAIADNVYPDQQNYISNRPMQIMAAGGAVCLHQRVEKMELLAGWQSGVHYVEWTDLESLKEAIGYLMQDWQLSGVRRMVATARAHVLAHHTFEARVKELMEKWV